MTEDHDMRALENAAAVLMEHFDSVQIFATRHTNDGTIACRHGRGNWYARLGHVQDWLTRNDEESRLTVRPENEE